MPRLSVNLTQEDNEKLEEFMRAEGFATKSAAILHIIISATNQRQNNAKMTQSPSRVTGVATLPNNNIYYGNQVSNETDFPNGRIKNNGKKSPPTELPPHWEPSEHLRSDYCKKYGVEYSQALPLFHSLVNQEGERSRNWDATWNVKLMKGVLKHTPPVRDDEELSFEDTMAWEYGN